ncbi:hypothetical protein MKEN_00255500 [Mycena kentingensis (nom. inval.)]|nr:hypothetical protein MKEN_00255500 [Mycena kentingensis (nom. inval.)]
MFPRLLFLALPVFTNAAPALFGGLLGGNAQVAATVTVTVCGCTSPTSVSSGSATSSTITIPTGTAVDPSQQLGNAVNALRSLNGLLSGVTGLLNNVVGTLTGSQTSGLLSQLGNLNNGLGGLTGTLSGITSGVGSGTSNGNQISSLGTNLLQQVQGIANQVQTLQQNNPSSGVSSLVQPLTSLNSSLTTVVPLLSDQCATSAQGQALRQLWTVVQNVLNMCLVNTQTGSIL